jgi:transmembrane sensor
MNHSLYQIQHAKEQAASWFARVQAGELSSHEQRELRLWRNAHAENELAWNSIQSQWSAAEALKDSPELIALRAEARRSDLSSSAGNRSWRLPLALAASIAFGMVVSTFAFKHSRMTASPAQTFATAIGEQKTFELQDQSQLMLDTDTEARVVYTDERREVQLLKGRAHFIVAHNPDRPFIVQAGSGSIRALGTVFDVSKLGDTVTVFLASGRVQVGIKASGAADTATLLPGEEVSYENATFVSSKRALSGDVAMAWQHRDLVLHETSLLDAVTEMNRYSREQIVIDRDESLRSAPLNGVFHVDDRRSFLEAVQAALSVDTVAERNGDVLLKRRQ